MFVALAVTLAGPLSGSPPIEATSQVGSPSSSAQVVVTGRRPDAAGAAAQVRAFTGAAPDVQMARWSEHLCPAVTGLDEAQNALIAEGMVQVGRSVGVKAQVGGCTPDVLVMITARPANLVEALLKQRSRFFSNHVQDSTIRTALGQDRPVRWMLSTETRATNGQYLQAYETALGGVGIKEDHARNSRIATTTQQTIQAVLMIVDSRRIDGLGVGALSGYLAMAALAQVKPEQEFKDVDTVMNLFAADAAVRPKGLTSWDRTYLAGLYAADPASQAHRQREVIARRIGR